MLGREDMMTHGDPDKMEIIACLEVSLTIVVPVLGPGRRGKRNRDSGSPDAGKPLVGWKRAKVSMKHNPSS